ncbi:MAG: HEPN domain-containing protein [Thermoproteales archaeon]|nr:HEPN domain-containing protein [Thermoproteales archaeon]
MKLPAEWVEKADFLIGDAEKHLIEGVYWIVCFEAQQAAELYLRGLHLALTGLHPYTHDLVELLDSLKDLGLGPSENLYLYADALTPHYTMSRYPGRKPVTYNRSLAERCIKYAKEIIKWVKEEAVKIQG